MFDCRISYMKQPCTGTGAFATSELRLCLHVQWLSMNNCRDKKNLLKRFTPLPTSYSALKNKCSFQEKKKKVRRCCGPAKCHFILTATLTHEISPYQLTLETFSRWSLFSLLQTV